MATYLLVGALWADTCCGQAVAGPDRDTNDGWPRGAVGLLEAILPHHGSSVEHLAFSPNGELLATAVSTKSSVWDAASGRRLAHLELKRGTNIAAVGFFAEGDRVLHHARGSETFVWSVAKRRWVPGPSFQPPLPRDARLVEVSRDGRNVLFRTGNGPMLYDTGSGRRIGALTADSESHLSNFDLEGTKVAFVIYRSKEKTRTIEIWDLAAEKQLCVLPQMETYISTFALSPTAETIVFATHEARIVQWDVARGKEIRKFPGPGGSVKSLAFSPDGRLLAAATYPHQVTVFDATTAQVRWRVQGHRPTGLRLVFSASGDTLATAGENNTLWLWDAETGKCKLRRGENGEPPSQCFRGPNGDLIATLSVDKTLHDAGGRRIGQFTVGGFHTHGGGVQQIVFSPDGRLAADSRRKDAPAVRDAIVLRDVATGRTLASLSRGRNTRSAVGALSPDGRLQAAALSDGAVELSDVYYPDNRRV